MSNYAYFWDQPANILIIRCKTDDHEIEPAVVTVAMIGRNGGSETIACVAVGEVDDTDVISVAPIMIALPDEAQGEGFSLEIVGYFEEDTWNHSDPNWSDRVFLSRQSEDLAMPEARSSHWYVKNEGGRNTIDVIGPDGNLPPNAVSQYYASTRLGQTIFPATPAEKIENPIHLRVDVETALTHDGYLNYQLRVGPVHPQDALTRTEVRAFTLSSSRDLVGALSSNSAHISMNENGQRAVLSSVDDQLPKEHIFYIPDLEQRHSFGDDLQGLNAAPEIGFLDRIVITTDPPTPLVVHGANNNVNTDGPESGIVALVAMREGHLHIDRGKVVDLVKASAKTERKGQRSSHSNSLATRYLTRQELDLCTQITASAYDDVIIRINENLSGTARPFVPNALAHFCLSPSFFQALAGKAAASLEKVHLTRALVPSHKRPEREAIVSLARAYALSHQTEALSLSEPIYPGQDIDRVVLWIENGEEFCTDKLAVVLISDLRKVLQSGVAPFGQDLGLLQDTMASHSDKLRKLHDHLSVLTRAWVLPCNIGHQLTPGHRIEARTMALETLHADAEGVLESSILLCRVMSPRRVDARLESFAEQKDDISQKPSRNRAYKYFLETLTASGGELNFEAERLDLERFWDLLARVFASEIEDDYRWVRELVDYGAPDPIKLATDHVVPIGQGMAPSAQKPADETLNWLFSDDDWELAPIIRDWKEQLRQWHRAHFGKPALNKGS